MRKLPSSYKHPAWFYIKYLLLGKVGPKAVVADLRFESPPNEEMVVNLASKLMVSMPATMDITVPSSLTPTDRDYLNGEGVLEAVDMTPDMVICLLLVDEDLSSRYHVDSLLLGGFDADAIVKLVENRTGSIYTKEVIELYKHYFYNTGIMTPDDWTRYLSDADTKVSATVIGNRAYALSRIGVLPYPGVKDMISDGARLLYNAMIEATPLPVAMRSGVILRAQRGLLDTYKTTEKGSDEMRDIVEYVRTKIKEEKTVTKKKGDLGDGK